HDRLGVRLDLGGNRLVNLVGEFIAYARDTIAHISGGQIGIAGQFEPDRDLAALGAADRGQQIYTLYSGEALFERAGDLAFDNLRTRSRIAGRHRDHRLVDIRVFAYRQPLIGNDTEQHDHEAQDRRENRPAYAEVGQVNPN